MIRRLVLRSLRHRPGRSLLLLAGYALGVGVTVALLSIGSAMVRQAGDRTLVGGGDLTVVPAGLDLETFRTGGTGSLYVGIEQAPFLYRQVLAGPRFAERVSAAAPWIEGEVLYLELPDRIRPVSADGRIPSLARALGAGADVTAGVWRDLPADRRWTSPSDSALYAEIDAFHLPNAAADTSWAEWHYFNVLLPDGAGWLYLTYMVAGDVPDGRWGGRLLGTLVTREAGPAGGDARYRTRRFRRDVPAGEVRFSLVRPDLRIGSAAVELGPGGRYRLRAEIPPADAAAPALRVELTLTGDPRSHLPPLDVSPGAFPSGYVVPALDGRAAGRVCVGNSCRRLEDAPAYHDHNWGRWSGVAWDWGHARAGRVSLLYGGVRRDVAGQESAGGEPARDGGPPAAAGRRFLFVTDSLGFAGLFTVDRLEHRWRTVPGAAVRPGGGPRRRPEALEVRAVRGRDSVRLRARIGHARSSRPEGWAGGAERPLLFWQMRGAVRLDGRLLGRPLAGEGDGFFETWAPASHADSGTYLE